jgi:1-acyl-sn-glycerol-3-phosphate acyltransferase
MQIIGSMLFTAFLFVWTFVFAIYFVIACLFLPFPLRYRVVRQWSIVILKVLKWTCHLDYVVEGLDNLPPGNHIAFWKHSSSWETIAMGLVFPQQVWVLKRELIYLPVVGWGIQQLHAIAIDRKGGKSAVNQVVDQGKARLSEGSWVMIYPEGTRMPPGVTRRYGVSGTLLAQAAGKLIVPVAHSSGFFWPRRGLMKRPGTIRVVIGPAVDPQGRDVREVNDEVQAWIEGTVSRLQAESAAGVEPLAARSA